MTANVRRFRLIFLAVLGVLVLVAVPAALAGKGSGGGGGNKPRGGGGTGGSGSLSLVVVSSPMNDNLPHWGGQITFNVSTTATAEPHVSVTCSQKGSVVYGAATGYYASYPWPWTQTMTLSSSSWTGGQASCVAKLYYVSGTSTVGLGSMSFTAYA